MSTALGKKRKQSVKSREDEEELFAWLERSIQDKSDLKKVRKMVEMHGIKGMRRDLGTDLAAQPEINVSIGGESVSFTRYGPDSVFLTSDVLLSALLPDVPIVQIEQGLRVEGKWADPEDENAFYRGKPLKRTMKYVYCPDGQGRMPRYNFPGFQHRQMLTNYNHIDSVPTCASILHALSRITINGVHLGPFNHAIVTEYADGRKCIGAHSDKIADIVKRSHICMLSFGDTRELHLSDLDTPDQVKQVVVLKAGDLFILGPLTNLVMAHAIPTRENERELPREREINSRISVVARSIETMFSTEEINVIVAKNDVARAKKQKQREQEHHDNEIINVIS